MSQRHIEKDSITEAKGASDPLPLGKRLLFATVTLCLASALALVLGELVVRIAAPQQLIMLRPDIWASVDSLGWMHEPNLRTEVNTGERTVTLVTDAEGFRVGEDGRRSASDSILLLGDSFMAALQVEYAESLAGLIEDSVHGPNGERVAVRNTGVGSWDPWHYLILARRRFSEHRYALNLVAVFVGNDVVHRRIEYFSPRQPEERARLRIPWSWSLGEWVDGVARPINDFLETRSHLFVFVKNRTESLRIRVGLSPAYMPSVLLRSRANGDEWDITAEILADVAEVADSAGVPTMFVLIPAKYQVDEHAFVAHARAFGVDTAAVDLDQPNRILSQKLEERDLDVIDALRHFRSASDEGELLYGQIDTHLSPRGHQVLFELLRPSIEEKMGW